jgi:hypothetical protein
MKKRYSKIQIFAALFFVIFFPLFFAFFQFYCLWDADFLGPPMYESPDLLSQPPCPAGKIKALAFACQVDSSFIPDSNIFRQPLIIPSQISHLEVITPVLRC